MENKRKVTKKKPSILKKISNKTISNYKTAATLPKGRKATKALTTPIKRTKALTTPIKRTKALTTKNK